MSGACCSKCQTAGVTLFAGMCAQCTTYTSVADVVGGSLLEALQPCVDQVRDIYTQLGARRYSVTLVWIRWSGGERGVGNPYLAHEEPIMPTPKVGDISRLDQTATSVGTNESGKLSVSEISTRYYEDTLLGRDFVVERGGNIPHDIEFFWEIVFHQAGNADPIRRRFQPASTPNLDPTQFGWAIELHKSDADRSRVGEYL